jgi:predicted DNA-binding protein
MGKGFAKNNPLEKLSGTTQVTIPDEKSQAAETVRKTVEKRKPGRPPVDPSGRKKKDYTKTINIAVPIELLDKLNTVKICYGNNLTQYINKLIEKDIEANYEDYKHIADSLNSFK